MLAAQDADGRSLWELTWSRARVISSGLQPQLLAASGVPRRLKSVVQLCSIRSEQLVARFCPVTEEKHEATQSASFAGVAPAMPPPPLLHGSAASPAEAPSAAGPAADDRHPGAAAAGEVSSSGAAEPLPDPAGLAPPPAAPAAAGVADQHAAAGLQHAAERAGLDSGPEAVERSDADRTYSEHSEIASAAAFVAASQQA